MCDQHWNRIKNTNSWRRETGYLIDGLADFKEDGCHL